MYDDKSLSGSEHEITRQGWASFFEVYGLSDDGGLEVQDVEERGPCKMAGRYECSCGRQFNKEETAVGHLRTVQDEQEIRADGGQPVDGTERIQTGWECKTCGRTFRAWIEAVDHARGCSPLSSGPKEPKIAASRVVDRVQLPASPNQKTLLADGGTVETRTYRERVITHTSRRYIEIREAECLNCGETVSRALDTRTFTWDTLPERCWNCGEPTPWEKGLYPESEERNNRSVDTDTERSGGDD